MKLLNFTAKNFGSYEEISFSFEQGLVLISGLTGSGKSTFQDIAFWGLFGITAKGGSVDDVRSWTNPDSPTEVKVSVMTSNGILEVTRIRGRSNENDLFWSEQESDTTSPKRGKDIKETQSLLEKRLGVSSETYQTSAYFHEFSPTIHFFYESKKNQRSLLESIANLEWPIRLGTNTKREQKAIKLEIQELEKTIEKQKGKLEQLNNSYVDSETRSETWYEEQKIIIRHLQNKSDSFDTYKKEQTKILQCQSEDWQDKKDAMLTHLQHRSLELTDICSQCKQPNKEANVIANELSKWNKTKNLFLIDLNNITKLKNTYFDQVQNENKKINPFLSQIISIKNDIDHILNSLMFKVMDLQELKTKQSYLEILLEYTYELRGQLLINSVKSIESAANQYLNDYFDAELRFTLNIEGSDSITLNIYKNGHECNFKQLSKGQRGLLNLCFSVAVMEACQNRSGVHFNQLFFDEALSGFDAELKVKAFRLFQHLNLDHESIYLIDHSTEFKSLFDKQYIVEISSDISTMILDE